MIDCFIGLGANLGDRMTTLGRAMSDGMVSACTDEPMYRLPVMAVATLTLLGPMLGLGEAALRLAADKALTRPLSDTIYHPKSQSVGIQVQVAEAALMLQTARLHAFQIADELDYCAATGQTVDYRTRARMRAPWMDGSSAAGSRGMFSR